MIRRFAVWAMSGIAACVLAYGFVLVDHNAHSQTGPAWCTPLVDCLGPGGKVGLDDWLNAKLYTEAWELIKTTRNFVSTASFTMDASTCTNHWHISTNLLAKTITLCPTPTGGETVIISDAIGSAITIAGNGANILQGAQSKTQLVSSSTNGDFCALIAKDATNWRVLGCVGFN